jgi:hypothetical protein
MSECIMTDSLSIVISIFVRRNNTIIMIERNDKQYQMVDLFAKNHIYTKGILNFVSAINIVQ